MSSVPASWIIYNYFFQNKGSQTTTSSVTSETQTDNPVKDKEIETVFTYNPDENVVRREVQELKVFCIKTHMWGRYSFAAVKYSQTLNLYQF